MKWDGITHGQLERMEAQAMERKSIDWSYWLDWAAALIVIATLIIGAALYTHMRSTAPCSFWANHPVANIPGRCLAEMTPHG